jgi:hypothetical protein
MDVLKPSHKNRDKYRDNEIFVHSVRLSAGNILLQNRRRPDGAAVNFSCALPLLLPMRHVFCIRVYHRFIAEKEIADYGAA